MSHIEQQPNIRHVWPLLIVQEIERSIKFYCQQIGFQIVDRAETDGKVFWCRVERGGSSLMLQQAEPEDGPADGRGRGVFLYFVCDDVDLLYTELLAGGLTIQPPNVAYYGMKQLFVNEPDGYSICFESRVIA